MDCLKTGALIKKLRTEKGMTQKQVAQALNISDKAISKWERGMGCPDVSLLSELSALFGVNVEKLLLGSLEQNDTDGGNMKRIKFYLCPDCLNVITATGEAEISCCGRKLQPLEVKQEDEEHCLKTEVIEDDYYIAFSHEMTKTHFITFVAHVSYDRVLLVKLYPEQNGEVRFRKAHRGKLYFCCNKDGLFVHE